jgi:hypothetical protein
VAAASTKAPASVAMCGHCANCAWRFMNAVVLV